MLRKKLSLSIFLFALTTFAWADETSMIANVLDYLQRNAFGAGDPIDITQNDPSFEYLGLIFGNISSISSTNTIIPEMFRILNIGVSLALVTLMISSAAFGVSSTSADGGAIGSGRASPFAVFRTVAGFALVIPTAGGYSLVQKIVMKVILAGVVSANYGWGLVLDHYKTVPTPPSSTLVEQVPNAKILMGMDSLYNWGYTTSEEGAPLVYNLRHDGEVESKEILSKVNVAITNMLSIFNAIRTMNAGYVYGPGASPQVTTNVQQRILPIGEVYGDEAAKRVDLEIYLKQAGRMERIYTISGVDRASNSDKLVKLMVSLQTYIKSVSSALMSDYEVVISGTSPDQSMSSRNSQMSRRAYLSALDRFVKNAPSLKVTIPPPDNAWVAGAESWGWLGIGVYYLDFVEAKHQKNTNDVIAGAQVSVWIPETFNITSYEYTSPADSSLIWKYKQLRIDNTMPEIAPPNGFLPWLNDLPVNINKRWVGIAAGSVPTNADGFPTEAFESILPLSADSTKFAVPNLSLAAGDLNLDAQLPLRNMASMSEQVMRSILGLQEHSNDLTGYGLFSYNQDQNQLNSLRQMGSRIFLQAANYWKDVTWDMYTAINKAQLTAYGITSGAIAALAAYKYYVSAAKDRSLKGKEIGTQGGAYIKYGALNALPGILTEPILQLVNFTTTVTKSLFGIYLPLGNGLATVYFLAGVILSVYVPFVPAIIFIFAIIAWLFAVVEAMVASPLIALGVAHPEGHEVLGRSEQAVMLLVGVFLRPMLTMIGMLIGLSLCFTAIKLYHMTFLGIFPAFIRMLNGSEFDVLFDELLVRTFFISGLVILYVYALMVIVEQCFTMIYMIPDRVLRWVGGPLDSAGGGVGAGAIQSISSGLSQDMGAAGQAAGTTSSGAVGQDISVSMKKK